MSRQVERAGPFPHPQVEIRPPENGNYSLPPPPLPPYREVVGASDHQDSPYHSIGLLPDTILDITKLPSRYIVTAFNKCYSKIGGEGPLQL